MESTKNSRDSAESTKDSNVLDSHEANAESRNDGICVDYLTLKWLFNDKERQISQIQKANRITNHCNYNKIIL